MEKPGEDLFQVPKRAVGKAAKARVVPEWYILPRRSIPRTIAWYSFLTAAGVGAGMVVEAWIKQQVASKNHEIRTSSYFVNAALIALRCVGIDQMIRTFCGVKPRTWDETQALIRVFNPES